MDEKKGIIDMKVSDYVIQFLADLGIRHIFYVSGGGAMHLNDSLGKNQQVEGVCMLHEQGASIAAEAYAGFPDPQETGSHSRILSYQ